jgi:S-adenosylmethionine:tRNA ribosyltransferase-isomerase
MIAAHLPIQRPRDARLLVIDTAGRITQAPRSQWVNYLRAGDLVVANDAATLPASLHGRHEPSGAEIEVRLAGRRSLHRSDVHAFSAVVFGAGDFRTRTEDRRPPPALSAGDRVVFGPGFRATIGSTLGHARLVIVRFDGSPAAVWAGLARHGRPIQYAHVPAPLALWDVWTRVAAVPAAFEPPSASFVLDWQTIIHLRARDIQFATITLAAGISSTGDPELDARFPLDEAYRIGDPAAAAILRTRQRGGRIVAVGTTVVRALEHAAARDGIVHAGENVANQRIGPTSAPRVVDAVLSGTHEPDSSHYQLLRAFTCDHTLHEATLTLRAFGYRTHEFGDSVLVWNGRALSPATFDVTCSRWGEPRSQRGRLPLAGTHDVDLAHARSSL